MTLEEKCNAIDDYCRTKSLCTCDQEYPCPLAEFREDCTDEGVIERNFKLVSAMPDYKGQQELTPCTIGVGAEAPVEHESKVDHPSHYNQGGIECIDAMVSAFGKEATAGFCIINAFKYVWRASEKNGIEDIDKAIWYLNKFKELSGNV